MVREELYMSAEEAEITITLIAIICSYGNGLPLDCVDDEFDRFNGYRIPYKRFGYSNLRSYINTLPEIYIVENKFGDEVLIQNSRKSAHINDLIAKQKNKTTKRKVHNDYEQNDYEQNDIKQKRRRNNSTSLASSGFHGSSDNSFNAKHAQYAQLESMLPIFYKHQALGDDFFVDIADTKMGYYVPQSRKECGLCAAGQTIASLTEKVQKAPFLAPRVVIMIGYQDLILGHSVNDMIYKFRNLMFELKKKNVEVTLMTLIETPSMRKNYSLRKRMEKFNNSILDYAIDHQLFCNIIDMNGIFEQEKYAFRHDFNRFTRVAKNDEYKVFSDYGRKVFLNALKTHLKHQIEAGN